MYKLHIHNYEHMYKLKIQIYKQKIIALLYTQSKIKNIFFVFLRLTKNIYITSIHKFCLVRQLQKRWKKISFFSIPKNSSWNLTRVVVTHLSPTKGSTVKGMQHLEKIVQNIKEKMCAVMNAFLKYIFIKAMCSNNTFNWNDVFKYIKLHIFSKFVIFLTNNTIYNQSSRSQTI